MSKSLRNFVSNAFDDILIGRYMSIDELPVLSVESAYTELSIAHSSFQLGLSA